MCVRAHIRQFEAIVRIAESLAKMRLSPFANEADAEEAIRLFQVSTMDAALTGNLEGVEGYTSQQELDLVVKIEKLIKKRFVIGSQVSQQTITQDFVKQVWMEKSDWLVVMTIDCRGSRIESLPRCYTSWFAGARFRRNSKENCWCVSNKNIIDVYRCVSMMYFWLLAPCQNYAFICT